MRSNAKRRKIKFAPQILQFDVRPHKVQVMTDGKYVPQDGFALFATGYDQLSGGLTKQIGVERPLYAHTDRRMVEARARFHMGRKMRRAYREKVVIVQMKPE